MSILGLEGYWNIIVVIPVIALITFGISSLLPIGRKKGEAPYVTFDQKLDAHIAKRGISVPENHDSIHYGRPCGPECWLKPDGHRWGE